ncbi:glutathione S-transferase family protein [soil metagenome]
MTPIITAFEASPDRGRGLARDMRVRWALEEVGQPYDVRLLSFVQMKQPEHLARQPFGQIPTYEEGDLVLFECGAIVLHVAERRPGLLPDDADGRARAISWLVCALSTMEPPIVQREQAILFERDEPWFEARGRMLDERVGVRLKQLSDRLGDAPWLDGEFSVGDLMMVEVLLRPAAFNLLGDWPNLAAYVARAQARPAFQRAFAAQLAGFEASRNDTASGGKS